MAIVLLHGFGGTGRSWDAVRAELDPARYPSTAPDLRGHGDAAHARPVGWDEVLADVLAAAPPRFTLAGYSLGGRVALRVALAAPERVERLVLLATTAGIEDAAERRDRAAADAALADRIEGGTIEQFAADWMAQPLFAGTPPRAAAAWRADLLRNDPVALAAALRGLGTGTMAPVWGRLPGLTMPADVVVGERDAKFRTLGERLAAALPDARAHLVPGAGHGLPREAPRALARILTDT